MRTLRLQETDLYDRTESELNQLHDELRVGGDAESLRLVSLELQRRQLVADQRRRQIESLTELRRERVPEPRSAEDAPLQLRGGFLSPHERRELAQWVYNVIDERRRT